MSTIVGMAMTPVVRSVTVLLWWVRPRAAMRCQLVSLTPDRSRPRAQAVHGTSPSATGVFRATTT
ncbi:hypothetical protein ACFCYI_23135 [Streptomyces sp. NPDC056257]|uniref:hypothetical protein n=1 Tax=Streptomyces sp. NPDC056257 TaxID=3345765 RepID=UPI0035DCA667